MAEDRVIGLNETQLGIVAPFFFADLMERAIGTRNTELALLAGTLFKSQDAQKIGLCSVYHSLYIFQSIIFKLSYFKLS